MSAPMKMHPTPNAIHIVWHGHHYAIPIEIIEKYKIDEKNELSPETIFAELIEQHSEAGLLLKGLRHKEGLTQTEFAEKIGLTQANISAMENGRRHIGKTIAKRLQTLFGVDYRLFL